MAIVAIDLALERMPSNTAGNGALSAYRRWLTRVGVRKPRALIAFVLLCLVAEAINAAFTYPALRSGWFTTLVQPTWSPPSVIFGPVWTALYLSQ